MGMDVHDMENLDQINVGFDDEVRPNLEQFGTNCLRMGRRLEEGFVVTDEPGVYFIPALIDDWKASGHCAEFLNFDRRDSLNRKIHSSKRTKNPQGFQYLRILHREI